MLINPKIHYTFYSLLMTGAEKKRREKAALSFLKYEKDEPGNYGSTNCLDYYKCIFLHVPKTAGISISKTLFGNHGPSHLNYDWFVENFGAATTKAYYKFTFVRNPWDRIFSAYHFLKKGGINDDNKEFVKKNLTQINSFEEFIMDWLNEETINSYWHFIPQYKFITSSKDPHKIMADFIGRFESVETDFKVISKALGIDNKKLLKENVSNTDNKKYTAFYSNEMTDKVAALYADDIELLHYKFGY